MSEKEERDERNDEAYRQFQREGITNYLIDDIILPQGMGQEIDWAREAGFLNDQQWMDLRATLYKEGIGPAVKMYVAAISDAHLDEVYSAIQEGHA